MTGAGITEGIVGNPIVGGVIAGLGAVASFFLTNRSLLNYDSYTDNIILAEQARVNLAHYEDSSRAIS
jgi:hypothetical protein